MFCVDLSILKTYLNILFFYSQNTRETAAAVKHMHVKRATRYLKNVIAKKEVVPFTHFNGAVGRKAQVNWVCLFSKG